MPISSSIADRVPQPEAVIQRMDVVNREMELLIGEHRWIISVPPDCAVLLRGERVKLRMLQPGDRVRVTYRADTTPPVACIIEAHSGERFASQTSDSRQVGQS